MSDPEGNELTGPFESRRPLAPRERFAPGMVLAGRYRIVALLGKGGMGEVYRADDLTLGQSLALKFLPRELASDPERLTRFRLEVARARHISHPHVCRVYDLAEHDGQPFLTMEYIDGEDLASLLKRVRRLSEEKGIEAARQLSSALAEVHEEGLLHRDLKPGNVMLDGRGRVRLTDFGLAAVAGEAADIGSGTPAYMAPEQLAGKEVTVQSDLYALGLVLYELFTGKRAFETTSREELAKRHAETPLSKPSSHVSGLDPAVEQVILRCLEKEPKDRPRSAHEVLAALPGGDPLTAAIAAGETPSPQMVANAPVEGSLSPAVGLTLLALVLLGIVAIAFLNDDVMVFRRAPLNKHPEILAYQARTIAQELGYGGPLAADSVHGFERDVGMRKYLQKRDSSPARWDALATGQPALMYFWYRQSPVQITQRLNPPFPWFLNEPGRVTPDEPPMDVPGMVKVILDVKGRLLEFHAVPPRVVPGGEATPLDWDKLFDAAGLKREEFKETVPRWNPPVYADAVKAWLGMHPEGLEMPLRVEAFACQGKAVYFRLEPADSERLLGTTGRGEPYQVPGLAIFVVVTTLSALTAGVYLAWRNWRIGRANTQGARRLAVFFFCTYLLFWLLVAHHTWSFNEELFGHFAPMVGRAIVYAALLWLIYVALEPYVRRRWPWRIVAWNRLLEGRFRDPLIGRDVLIGVLGGILVVLTFYLSRFIPGWFGEPQGQPGLFNLTIFTQPLAAGLTSLLMIIPVMLSFLLAWLLVFLLRWEWLAAIVWGSLPLLFNLPQVEYPMVDVPLLALSGLIHVGLLFRYGLLAFAAGFFTQAWLSIAPLTVDLSAWYATIGVAYALVLVGLAGYGCLTSLGSRSLFAGGPNDAE